MQHMKQLMIKTQANQGGGEDERTTATPVILSLSSQKPKPDKGKPTNRY